MTLISMKRAVQQLLKFDFIMQYLLFQQFELQFIVLEYIVEPFLMAEMKKYAWVNNERVYAELTWQKINMMLILR